MPELMNPAPGLPRDDFRRAHDGFRGAHYNCRRSHPDFVMMFVSRLLVLSASRENASGGGEKGDDVMMPLKHKIFYVHPQLAQSATAAPKASLLQSGRLICLTVAGYPTRGTRMSPE